MTGMGDSAAYAPLEHRPVFLLHLFSTVCNAASQQSYTCKLISQEEKQHEQVAMVEKQEITCRR